MNKIKLSDTLFNSTALSLQYLIDIIGIKATRKSLRESILTSSSFPEISLGDISKILSDWKIENIALQGDLELLKTISYPAIIHITNPNNPKSRGVFAILTALTDTFAYYYSPGVGIVKEPISDFKKRWGGIVLAIEIISESGDADYESAKKAERYAIENYKNKIKIIDDFISPEQCNFMVEYCDSRSLFLRSKIELTSENDNEVSSIRTSYSALLEDRAVSLFNLIYEKSAEFTNVNPNQIEYLQCVRYGPKQQYGVHFDGNSNNRRLYTMLLYLNDDFEGGETIFPEIDLTIKPKKGRVIFFPNLDEEMDEIIYSAHAGLPVTSGMKYACNIWIRDYDLKS